MSGDPAEPRDDADRFDDFYDNEWPEGAVVCDRCNGKGTVDCMCCGDFCCCGVQDELTCPVCLGAEYITQERWEKRAAAHREIMAALWGTPAESPSLSPSPQPSGTANPVAAEGPTEAATGPLSEPKEGR